ncbi:MAG TPA: DNA repair protein RadA, partial [Anaerolineaceae bacterium]|nr:DNA repair protein RadA [Anaerolineaceae bacterium]
MAKTQTRYICQNCGRTAPQQLGRCPQCGSWGSMVEEIIAAPARSASAPTAGRGLSTRSQPRPLAAIEGDAEARMPLSIGEFSRVLGGGIVAGSIILVGGDPGIGKSTLLL